MNTDPRNVGNVDSVTVPPLRTAVVRQPVVDVVTQVENRVQWGPVFAGLITALTLFLLLNVLGLALGASVLQPADSGGEIGAWAGIWSAVAAIVAFFLGGWIAAKTAAVGGSFGGIMNGVLVAAAGLLLVVYLTTSGLGALFGTIGANVGGIADAASRTAQQQGVSPQDAQQDAQQAAQQVQAQAAQVDPNVAFQAVRNGALGTFVGMLIPLIAAGLGGYAGRNKAEDIVAASA